KKFAGKSRHGELAAGAGGAVHDQDGIGDDTLRIGTRLADEAVMQPELRQRFAAVEVEILDDVIGLLDRRIAGGAATTAAGTGGCGCGHDGGEDEGGGGNDSVELPCGE